MRLKKGQASNNFWFGEFKVSVDYPELASRIQIIEYQEKIISFLCDGILQPIRNYFGKTEVLSAVRSEELNKAVGGSNTSDHLYIPENKIWSCATDFSCEKSHPEKVFRWIIEQRLPFRQLIYYLDKILYTLQLIFLENRLSVKF